MLLLLAIPGVGTAMAAVTIDTISHTVTTSKLAIQFGNATTNTPDDPERIDSLKGTGSSTAGRKFRSNSAQTRS